MSFLRQVAYYEYEQMLNVILSLNNGINDICKTDNYGLFERRVIIKDKPTPFVVLKSVHRPIRRGRGVRDRKVKGQSK